MKKQIDYLDLGMKIVLWILGIALIYMLILKITGHSPTFETVTLAFIGIFGVALLHLYYHFGQSNTFVKETFPRFERNVKDSFDKIKEEFGEIRSELKQIKQKL